MAPPSLSHSPPPPLPELESILSALSAFAHRNKNQHRLSKWWKPFSQLRRQVSSLVAELALCHGEEAKYGVAHKKGLAARGAVERRVGFIVTALVPRAYLAFTTLVADNQYAALGLMLLATLARVRRLILPLRGAVEEEHDGKPYEVAMEGIEQRGLDLGEVIQRGEIQAEQDADDIGSEVKKPKGKKRENKEEGEGRSQAPVDARPTKRPKKKRKKGDAFDDIFDSLI